MTLTPGDEIGTALGVIDIGSSVLGVLPIPDFVPAEEDPRIAEVDRRLDRIDARLDQPDREIDDVADQIAELDALGTELIDGIGAVRNTVLDAAIADAQIIARGTADKLLPRGSSSTAPSRTRPRPRGSP